MPRIKEKIRAALLAEQESGLSQREIAERHGVSAPYVCTILNEKASLARITIDKVETMFPACDLILDASQQQDATQNNTQSNFIVNGNAIQRIMDFKERERIVAEARKAAISEFKTAASAAILQCEELPDSAMMRLIRAIHAIR